MSKNKAIQGLAQHLGLPIVDLSKGLEPEPEDLQGFPMTEEEMMEGPLPEWAIDRTDGTLYNGAQLPTRDGRKCGNAHVIGNSPNYKGTGLHVYHILTDAGTRMNLTEGEVAELFHPPKYLSSTPNVIRKFRPGDVRISDEVFLAMEYVLNQLPNRRIDVMGFRDTYELAAALSREKCL